MVIYFYDVFLRLLLYIFVPIKPAVNTINIAITPKIILVSVDIPLLLFWDFGSCGQRSNHFRLFLTKSALLFLLPSKHANNYPNIPVLCLDNNFRTLLIILK